MPAVVGVKVMEQFHAQPAAWLHQQDPRLILIRRVGTRGAVSGVEESRVPRVAFAGRATARNASRFRIKKTVRYPRHGQPWQASLAADLGRNDTLAPLVSCRLRGVAPSVTGQRVRRDAKECVGTGNPAQIRTS